MGCFFYHFIGNNIMDVEIQMAVALTESLLMIGGLFFCFFIFLAIFLTILEKRDKKKNRVIDVLSNDREKFSDLLNGKNVEIDGKFYSINKGENEILKRKQNQKEERLLNCSGPGDKTSS